MICVSEYTGKRRMVGRNRAMSMEKVRMTNVCTDRMGWVVFV